MLLRRGEQPGGRRIAAVALTACTTLAVSRAAVRACLNDRPHLWEGLAQDLIRRVAEDEERIMRLARNPVGVRLAWLLVCLARLGDAVEDDGRHVGATAAGTGNYAARGRRPGCGRPRAALPGAPAWRCRPSSPRIP